MTPLRQIYTALWENCWTAHFNWRQTCSKFLLEKPLGHPSVVGFSIEALALGYFGVLPHSEKYQFNQEEDRYNRIQWSTLALSSHAGFFLFASFQPHCRGHRGHHDLPEEQSPPWPVQFTCLSVHLWSSLVDSWDEPSPWMVKLSKAWISSSFYPSRHESPTRLIFLFLKKPGPIIQSSLASR